MKPNLNFPARLASLLLAALIAGLSTAATSGAAHATTAITDWFRIGKASLNEWDFVVQPNNTNLVRVKSKRFVSSQPLRRVMVLSPRRSSAYDTAMTTFLVG